MAGSDTTEGFERPEPGPPLRLLRGEATAEEVAAVVAVLSAVSRTAPAPAPRHTSEWGSPARAVRTTLRPGPGAWRSSAWR